MSDSCDPGPAPEHERKGYVPEGKRILPQGGSSTAPPRTQRDPPRGGSGACPPSPQSSHSGQEYKRRIKGVDGLAAVIDVYNIIEAYAVRCPGRQQALKKILCAGSRDKATTIQDLREAVDALERAIELEEQRDQ